MDVKCRRPLLFAALQPPVTALCRQRDHGVDPVRVVEEPGDLPADAVADFEDALRVQLGSDPVDDAGHIEQSPVPRPRLESAQ